MESVTAFLKPAQVKTRQNLAEKGTWTKSSMPLKGCLQLIPAGRGEGWRSAMNVTECIGYPPGQAPPQGVVE